MTQYTGTAERLTDSIWRLVAPNGGRMTGPGTNTYLLGARRQIVIDPGPADQRHADAILAAAGGTLSHILVTHTHPDHSPGVRLLLAATAAEVIGLPAPAGPNQDRTFAPDTLAADDMTVVVDDIRLRCVLTPGHASNHVCYLHEGEGILFTGDHVMQGSSVVIPPPDGDMAAYIASLQKVAALEPAAIAPGHGTLIDDPQRALRHRIRHRLQREARVYDRLATAGDSTADELLPLVYDDVPAAYHPVARLSLLAHLLKLRDDGRVAADGEVWRALATPVAD